MNDTTKIAAMIAEAVEARCRETETEVTMTTMERAIRVMLQEIGQLTLSAMIEAAAPRYAGPTVACGCGGTAQYVRRRSARLYTIFGKTTVRGRPYYLCPTCHQGSCPLDEQLGLRPNAFSAELARLVAMTGVQLPFQAGSELFEALTLVSVSDQRMGRAARQVGEEVVAVERALQTTSCDDAFLRRQAQTAAEKRPLRLYGSIDATKVHVRSQEGERWRDLKVGAWYHASGKPPASPDGEWRIQAQEIEYFADIAPAETFGSLLWATGVQRQANIARELIIIGDGAEWIWNLADEHFPDAVQILDWFHATEHLMPVAKDVFAAEDEQTRWTNQMRELMWQGKTGPLIDVCRSLASTFGSQEARRAANYFQTHRRRMRYAFFRKQGYQIGSGTIESAAKQIGLMRMKVPGAIWNEENARYVAKARAAYLSNRWADLSLAC